MIADWAHPGAERAPDGSGADRRMVDETQGERTTGQETGEEGRRTTSRAPDGRGAVREGVRPPLWGGVG